jgi:RimJ/RimL family protein N-acetyltransferase
MTAESSPVDERFISCETSRLAFAPLQAEHGPLLFDALGNPLVSEHLNCLPPPSVENLTAEFAQMAAGPPPHKCERWVNFAVQLKADKRWIGRVEATVQVGWAEVAYLFGPSDWGQGYATESLEWLHEYLSVAHSVREFWAAVAPQNERSIRLLLRCRYERVALCETRPLASYEPGDEVYCCVGRERT